MMATENQNESYWHLEGKGWLCIVCLQILKEPGPHPCCPVSVGHYSKVKREIIDSDA